MKTECPDIKLFDQRSILIDFGGDIDENMLDRILNIKMEIIENTPEVKLEVVHSYNSLIVIYPFTIKDVYSEKQRLKELLKTTKLTNSAEIQKFTIPVCYDALVAPDLSLISKEKKLSKKEVIDLHTAANYRVYLIGFLPGFLYLGGLDKRLEMPRKNQPRLNIAAGSVGIGGLQTGIYPKESPGGWQIIGRCPLIFFNPDKDPPMQISPGDRVKFYSVSLEEYREMEASQPDPLIFSDTAGESQT